MSVLLLSLACVSRTFMPYCEQVSETEIGDEELTEFGSPQERLDRLRLDQAVPALWADGAQTTAELSLSRGQGSAVYIEEVRGERVTEERSVGRSYDFYPAIDVVCSDRLQVPVTMELRTQDGALDLRMEGTSSVSWMSVDQAGASANAIRGMEEDELPVFERDPAEHTSLQLSFGVSALDGAVTSGALGWSGVPMAGQASTVSERVLELEPE